MMVRKFMAASAALVLAGVMSASTVSAKPCPKLCHAQIKACYATNCTTKPKGACKKDCRTHFITECKATSSTPKERTCPLSPSGAFLD